MSQLMPVLCPHGPGDGGGQPNVDRLGLGEVGAKILKLVRTSFMDDPTAKRCKRKLDSIILFFFNVCYMNKQPPVVFLKISQNLQESTPVEMSYFQ